MASVASLMASSASPPFTRFALAAVTNADAKRLLSPTPR
eukprot:CAMPEP_0180466244 /NCGR_PEP_ID=MMETSP1036_2-20121128/26371_1 /TAXON_ID=632150 /ORGANISM="Azadinium spinosum, Strain 3D9" /LENGTH=38 /DNA_ID= /DNA_START= /DNA_END= /DNA_ORIENTATION=